MYVFLCSITFCRISHNAREDAEKASKKYNMPSMASWAFSRGHPVGMKVVLTGPPGAGKTTLLRRVIDLFDRKTACEANSMVPSNTTTGTSNNDLTHVRIRPKLKGVYCEECLAAGKRVGFDAIISSGERRSFMVKSLQVDSLSSCSVGKYAVDVDVIDNFIVPELSDCIDISPRLLYIDEIGKA